ncbi:hypothetical protein PQX77_006119 [Marasmius sp. AFHP31]|nr:hypothetical protein PQX77_006119 [Marasmius sp. AFHP31]
MVSVGKAASDPLLGTSSAIASSMTIICSSFSVDSVSQARPGSSGTQPQPQRKGKAPAKSKRTPAGSGSKSPHEDDPPQVTPPHSHVR